jgi:hypothetical protein
MRFRFLAQPPITVACAVAWALFGAGCGNSGGRMGDGGADDTPRYVLSSVAFDADFNATTYLALLDSIDVDEIDLGQAREFAGFADLWVRDGSVFVSTGDFTITKYSVEGRRLVEQGRLGFASYGPTDFGLHRNVFISPTKAYFLNGSSEYILWNPRSMEITGTLPLPKLADRDGLKAFPGYSDRAALVHDGLLYQPMYWTDESYFKFTPDSRVLLVDVERDEIVDVLDAPCPGLDFATEGASGNLYFSSWVFAPGGAAELSQPATCVVEMTQAAPSPSLSFHVADVTSGHEGGVMRHLGGDRFLLSVLHDEHAPESAAGDPQLVANGNNWRFWSYDRESGAASVLEGIGWNSGGTYAAAVGGRSLILVPTTDYSATTAYELLEDGSARRVFHTRGWSLRLFELPQP